MEKEVIIPTSNNKNIHGLLRKAVDSKALVIFVHGLTDYMNEPQFYLGARFIQDNSYDSFRFNLYGWESDARNLIDCDITTHSIDVDKVVEFFKKDYDKIFLVGHSLGASSIIYSNQDVDAIVFWDPSFKMTDIAKEFISFNEELDCYIATWGTSNLLSKKMILEWQNFNEDKYVEMISKPTKFIFAGEGILKDLWKPYLEKIPVAFEEVIVEGASHCFQEDGKFEILFSQTLSWFEKF